MINLYIRFNKLPNDGKSFIYNEDNIIIGKREGVSVFNCIFDNENKPYPQLPMPCTDEALKLFTKYALFDDGEDHPMFLVSGHEIDRDEMNFPIITNVKIISEIPVEQIFPDRKNELN